MSRRIPACIGQFSRRRLAEGFRKITGDVRRTATLGRVVPAKGPLACSREQGKRQSFRRFNGWDTACWSRLPISLAGWTFPRKPLSPPRFVSGGGFLILPGRPLRLPRFLPPARFLPSCIHISGFLATGGGIQVDPDLVSHRDSMVFFRADLDSEAAFQPIPCRTSDNSDRFVFVADTVIHGVAEGHVWMVR